MVFVNFGSSSFTLITCVILFQSKGLKLYCDGVNLVSTKYLDVIFYSLLGRPILELWRSQWVHIENHDMNQEGF